MAGCLIAYAYKQSIIQGKDHYQGILHFDVLEEKKADEIKLMALYSKKYNALRYPGTTTMQISDENGDELITRYLS